MPVSFFNWDLLNFPRKHSRSVMDVGQVGTLCWWLGALVPVVEICYTKVATGWAVLRLQSAWRLKQ